MDSPLFTGNGDSMKKVMKFLEKVKLQLDEIFYYLKNIFILIFRI